MKKFQSSVLTPFVMEGLVSLSGFTLDPVAAAAT